MRYFALLFGILLLFGLGGCSSRQLYESGQSWQRNQCNQIFDALERSRCLESTSSSFEEYRRESEAVRNAR
ncbi:hypothetical protein JCM30471_34280 [Desulfuromonas carbonis]|uniref:hypothetical protein n=1 Tax=Desulfuromonas sp. DDH964 TaxID=1823759 RepID=UPI00078CF73F|nr:hypothetical protein [Desulfuromonas sp. DDH964]AMV71911.1 hypothetical protein DBW_1549 [Desulfuromonas sp. DDH964]